MVKPHSLVRSRRKTLALNISKEGELIVKAPINMSLEKIFEFIEKKEKWIVSKQQEITKSKNLNKKVINYEQVLLLGSLFDVVAVNNIKKAGLQGNYLCVSSKIKPNRIKFSIKNWYTGLLDEVITPRVEYFANLMRVDFLNLTYINSKVKWGMCSSNKEVFFNWRLLMLPHKLIDYVIIHELSHLIELNHSANFWEVVESIMPNYKQNRKLLKESNFILELYR